MNAINQHLFFHNNLTDLPMEDRKLFGTQSTHVTTSREENKDLITIENHIKNKTATL